MAFDYRDWAPLLRKLRQGENLRRPDTGITAEELADEIGVSAAHVLQMERGDKPFSLGALIEYLNAFDQIATSRLEALGYKVSGRPRRRVRKQDREGSEDQPHPQIETPSTD